MLAEETPVVYRASTCSRSASTRRSPIRSRRAARPWRSSSAEACDAGSVEVTPLVSAPGEAEPWLQPGEGVIAKQIDAPLRPGERKGMVKVKRVRTADCVVVGWRPGKEDGTVGSLILGVYDQGKLRVVGHTSGPQREAQARAGDELAPYETGERGSADPSRWAADRELEWISLRPELVVEISFDHVSGGRIRHGSKILRWRDDKDPKDCSYAQLDA